MPGAGACVYNRHLTLICFCLTVPPASQEPWDILHAKSWEPRQEAAPFLKAQQSDMEEAFCWG
jgi:hypothetical protein